jgi:hypothetical protein
MLQFLAALITSSGKVYYIPSFIISISWFLYYHEVQTDIVILIYMILQKKKGETHVPELMLLHYSARSYAL